jgi:hypothetical protein
MLTIAGTPIIVWAATISAIAAAVAAVFNYLQSRRSAKQLSIQQKSERARIFKEIADRWSDIYQKRNDVLAAPILTQADLMNTYRNNYKQFLKTKEWTNLRDVCNFFEYLGVMLHEGYIEPGPLFVLVTVDVYVDVENGQETKNDIGVMYSRLKGPIDYLRHVYRRDIYVFYDYLRERYKAHKPMTPKVKLSDLDKSLNIKSGIFADH